jgi:hypothetical protein
VLLWMQRRAQMLMLILYVHPFLLSPLIFCSSLQLICLLSESVSESMKYTGPTFYKSITAICVLSKQSEGLQSQARLNVNSRWTLVMDSVGW